MVEYCLDLYSFCSLEDGTQMCDSKGALEILKYNNNKKEHIDIPYTISDHL